jgi:hypothetical protein
MYACAIYNKVKIRKHSACHLREAERGHTRTTQGSGFEDRPRARNALYVVLLNIMGLYHERTGYRTLTLYSGWPQFYLQHGDQPCCVLC